MPRLIADRSILHMTSELGRVMAAARAREAAGQSVIHLERGEPDFDTPPHVVEALAAAARAGETHYPDARGSLPLREALARKLERENGVRAHPDDIVVSVGGTHGLFVAFQALLGAGDELLALSPHWMAIPKLVALSEGAQLRTLPVYLELLAGRWTPAEFAERIRQALRPATRGIYLNTPNNPTGAVLEREYLQALADVAIERDLWVVSDEAYEHLVFEGARHVSIASLPGMADRTLGVYTFSKSYAMTGWRVGYIAAPPALRATLGPILSFYTTHGVFPAVQSAALAALTGPQDAVEVMRRAYQERRDLLLAGLAAQDAVRVPQPRGAFYCFADVSRALGERDLWSLIEEWLGLGVAVLPGTAFGPEFTDRVRMSLATRRDDLVQAARLLATGVRRSRARRDDALEPARIGDRPMGYCPECGTEYDPAVVACPRCRVVLSADLPSSSGVPEVVHRVPDAAAGALLSGVLEHCGIHAVLRSTTLPGYGTVRRDWSTSAWGEILVPQTQAAEARAIIADYLLALERGGTVRDEDVEGIEPGT